jgi:hypothetical protein
MYDDESGCCPQCQNNNVADNISTTLELNSISQPDSYANEKKRKVKNGNSKKIVIIPKEEF